MWNLLPLMLVLAFVLRAIVALSGDFILHPDEIFQYLEPAYGLTAVWLYDILKQARRHHEQV